jgi:hypothetical protein
MKFKQWFWETSLRDIIADIPQDTSHHPEGDVWTHTKMVRSAVFPALEMLRKKQAEDPQGPLSNLDLNLTKNEQQLLRIAALMHDIGKSEVTQKHPETGKITAYGHETPPAFEPAMKRLSKTWQDMYNNASAQDKEDLWFIIKNHMKLSEMKTKD